MTAFRIGSIHRYIGLAVDTASLPTDAPVGSELYAIDNRDTYVKHGDGIWYSKETGIPGASPSISPSLSPSNSPSNSPSKSPSNSPSASPS